MPFKAALTGSPGCKNIAKYSKIYQIIAIYIGLYVFLFVFIRFRQKNLGSRQALARLSLTKNKLFIRFKEGIVKGMYTVLIVF